MPFKSEKQKRYMYAKHPKIAKRWAKKYGNKIKRSVSITKGKIMAKTKPKKKK